MYEYKVKEILKIYDGDTITVVLDLGFGVTKTEKLRLAFINAPELRGDERPEGLLSRDWLRNEIYTAQENGKEILIKTLKDRKGKYGRYIAKLFIDGININTKIINEGFAVAY